MIYMIIFIAIMITPFMVMNLLDFFDTVEMVIKLQEEERSGKHERK